MGANSDKEENIESWLKRRFKDLPIHSVHYKESRRAEDLEKQLAKHLSE